MAIAHLEVLSFPDQPGSTVSDLPCGLNLRSPSVGDEPVDSERISRLTNAHSLGLVSAREPLRVGGQITGKIGGDRGKVEGRDLPWRAGVILPKSNGLSAGFCESSASCGTLGCLCHRVSAASGVLYVRRSRASRRLLVAAAAIAVVTSLISPMSPAMFRIALTRRSSPALLRSASEFRRWPSRLVGDVSSPRRPTTATATARVRLRARLPLVALALAVGLRCDNWIRSTTTLMRAWRSRRDFHGPRSVWAGFHCQALAGNFRRLTA